MSPDLNPIEWVWSDLKQYIRRKPNSTMDEIKNSIRKFQNKMTPSYCSKFVKRLKKVIKNVIQNDENI